MSKITRRRDISPLKVVTRADDVQPEMPSAQIIDLGARRKAKARAAVRRYIEGAGASSAVAFPMARQVRPDLERRKFKVAA